MSALRQRADLWGWAREVGQCPVCGLVYERNAGDTWGWVIIGDRIPVAAGIGIVYFRFGSSLGTLPLVLFFVVLIVILIWTAPNRWGGAIALHYLSRAYWPDPSDPLPPDDTSRNTRPLPSLRALLPLT